MRFADLLSLSLTNLWRRKLRTSLTVLGVLIGTASIIVMLSIGIGQQENMMKWIGGMDELTKITVHAQANGRMEGGFGPTIGQANPGDGSRQLTKEAIKQLASLPHVRLASPVLSVDLTCKQGLYEGHLQLEAYSQEALESMNLPIIQGKMVGPEEGRLPLLVGRQIGYNFYNPKASNYDSALPEVDLFGKPFFATIEDYGSPTVSNTSGEEGQAAPAKKELLQATGVIGSASEEGFSRYDMAALTELSALEHHLKKVFKNKAWPGQPRRKNGKPLGEVVYESAYLRVDDLDNTKAVMQNLKDLGYGVESNIEFIEDIQKETASKQIVLAGIGAVSLFVAAIGIANTMMMSIYERTREIGVFKVLGCSLANIRNMFLLEAGLIGLLGGFLGLIFSYIVSFIINTASGESMASLGLAAGAEGARISVIPIWLVFAGLIFAGLVGMVSGILPAIRAMRLSALEAIRSQ